MMLAVDVHYRTHTATAAGVGFDDWTAAQPRAVYTCRVSGVRDYIPGRFTQRELPAVLALIDGHDLTPHTILIDGYVYLDESGRPGLGKYLYDALNGRVPVVGVAKTAWPGIDPRHAVMRGGSGRPLYVTAAGMDPARAAAGVAAMHGPYRIPTLLKWVDQAARGRRPNGGQAGAAGG